MKVDEMELLVRIAETGSMTDAAKQLHRTPAAVSATVQRVESALGVRLFERTTRALHPTDEGLVIIEGCRDVVERWQRALEDARGEGAAIEGTVRLSAPADTTYAVLEPLVAELCTSQPKLRVVLATSDSPLHLHRDAIDMAIRYGPLQDSTLSARKLATCPGILVAAPSYVAAHGAPQTPRELSAHRCLTLHLSDRPVVQWELCRDGQRVSVPLDSPLCGDGYLARRWAIAGMGIAFKSLFDVIDDLQAGRLVPVLPDYRGDPIDIHAVFPSRRFTTTRVRALHEIIVRCFAERARRSETWDRQHVE